MPKPSAQITVSSKILLSFLAAIGLILSMGYFSVQNISRLSQMISIVFYDNVRPLVNIDSAQTLILRHRLEIFQHVAEKDPMELSQSTERIKVLERQIDELLTSREQHALRGGEVAAFENTVRKWNELKRLYAYVMQVSTQFSKDDAYDILVTDSGVVAEQLMRHLNALQMLKAANVEAVNAQSREITHATFMQTIGIVVIAVALSFALAFWCRHLVAEPISRLNEGVKIIASGKYDQPLEINRSDEIGSLADSFIGMQHAIREKISSLQEEIKRRKEAEAESQRLVSIMEGTPDIIVICDNEFQITYMNAAARERFGDATGIGTPNAAESFLSLFPSKDHEALERILAEASQRNAWQGELDICTHSKKIVPTSQVVIAHRPTTSDIDKIDYYSSVMRDISEQRRIRHELQDARNDLENRVEERTSDLQVANERLVEEVVSRKKAQVELERAQSMLIETAHKAGMADIAANMVHDVGNCLNSVITSSGALVDQLHDKRWTSVRLALDYILQRFEEGASVAAGENEDQKLAPLLARLGKALDSKLIHIQNDVKRVRRNLEVAGSLVSTYTEYTRHERIIETFDVEDLIEQSLSMLEESLSEWGVEVTVELNECPKIHTQRIKLLQILINIIANAAEATQHLEKQDRIVGVSTDTAEDCIIISVSDNGPGVPEELLTTVFSSGFTTKPHGNGYGLHTCANAAIELGGRIDIEEQQDGSGAIFITRIPLNRDSGSPEASV